MFAGDFPQQSRAHKKQITLKEKLDRSTKGHSVSIGKMISFSRETVNQLTR